MHDIKAIRENFPAWKAALLRRPLGEEARAQIDELPELESAVRALTTAKQEAEAARNAASKQIGQAKAQKDEARAQALMAEVALLKTKLDEAGEKEAERGKRLNDILASLPNIPAPDVPEGEDENANVEQKTWAPQTKPPGMSLNAPKDHVALGEALGMMDFEAAAKMSGARFVVLKGALARMERALAALMIDQHTEENGYTEVAPPLLVWPDNAFGTGQLPKFARDLFRASMFDADRTRTWADELARDAAVRNRTEILNLVESMRQQDIDEEQIELAIDGWAREDSTKRADQISREMSTAEFFERTSTSFFLTPTAEVSLTNLVREQITEAEQLPLRFTADTPCFRSEAGAAGKDTRGMIRMHQFRKVEMVSITTPEASEEEHERMTRCAEKILEALELPYRRMLLCTGDMGFSAKKTYDLEVWLPSQNKYREISSCSNCGDFQARRMNARFRRKNEKPEYVHTLNGSGLAVGRTLVAILENYQNPDGSITIPAALRPYMAGRETIAPA